MTPTDQLPALQSEVPGPRSRELAARLGAVESRNVTCLAPLAPIFWERASGANVWDVDGNRYVDLSGAFGVANVGHAHPRVVQAVQEQAATLLHGMGDVHPSAVKVRLLEALTQRFPGGGPARAILASSGSDAVEAALKTALLATGNPGVVAFEGAYHGLGMGALDTTQRAMFRDAFTKRLPDATAFARFGDVEDVLRVAGSCPAPVGAVLVEPVQGRGGERVPPRGFLRALRALCDERGWLLIVDEIYTGFGRTGAWFACDHEDVVPDLLCVAKGLASGMPISACVGRAEVMDAWPPSQGEALHTQTFLGHPPGCAAALASIDVIEREGLVARSAQLGREAMQVLEKGLASNPRVREVRGLGLMIGVACDTPKTSLDAVAALLQRGVIALPSGDDGSVIGLSPPLGIGRDALHAGLDALIASLVSADPRPRTGADPERTLLDAAVLAWTCEPSWQRDDARFDALARLLFAHQFARCATYRRFCESRGVSPATLARWQEIPPVPTGAFKEVSLVSFPPERAVHHFLTSGTSSAARGALHLDTLEIYEASLASSFARHLLPDLPGGERAALRILAPSTREAPDSSLSHMFDQMLDTWGAPGSGHWVRDGALDLDRALTELEALSGGGSGGASTPGADTALLICGTAFAFVHLLEALEARSLYYQLPASTRVMETGGFKGRSRELPRDELHEWIGMRLGVPGQRIVNQYGMTELGSQFYDGVLRAPDAPRAKQSPPWTRVRLLDEHGEDVSAPGGSGRIVIFDLANTGSVAAVETADLGRWVDAAGGFEVLGREAGAEERGCSIAADALLADESA